MEVRGYVTPGFESLLPVFETALKNSHGRGCAFNLRVRGAEVASLWGGEARQGEKWLEHTSTVLFSCTKGLLSLIAAEFVELGLLDLDSPVSRYWPEFAQNDKAEITVRQVLSHHGGLSAVRQNLTRADALNWETMVEVLAASKTIFDPLGKHQYHAVTFGWLVGEILRRISGKSLSQLVQTRLAEKMNVEVWVGIPEEKLAGVAQLFASPDNPPPPASDHWVGDRKYELLAMTLGDAFPSGPITENSGFNDPEVRMASIGGAGGIASAKSLAKIWSAAANAEPEKLFSVEIAKNMIQIQSEGDPAIHMDPPYPSWGTGFMLSSQARPFLTENSFGHDGFGGQVTYADIEHQVGFAFVTNDLQATKDQRANSLTFALREILDI